MSIDSDVYAVMANDAGLTALVGTRIYPQVIAQGEPMPAIVYAVKTDAFPLLHGAPGLHQSRIAVQVWSDSIAEAKTIADAVVAAFWTVFVPYAARDGSFDAEIGLHSEFLEFDWWSN
jgi:hypothetical protein